MDTCQVDIIVPIYGTLGFVKACVQAVLSNTRANFTLWLADDMSPGEEIGEYFLSLTDKRIKTLSSKVRRGFGGNNNWAVKHGNAEFICLLNSDTEVREGWLSAMLKNMSEPEVGIVGAKLLFPPAKGGGIQHCGVGRNKDGLPFHPGYGARASLPMADVRRYLNAVTAACMLVRRTCWDDMGGFDPIFGLGQFEDVDLCLLPDTLIACPDGVQMVSGLVAGDLVLGTDGEPRAVLEPMSRDYDGQVVRLRRSFGTTLSLTREHPVLTKVGWKDAGDLKTSDWVWCPGLAYLPGGQRRLLLEDWFDSGVTWRNNGEGFIFPGQHKDSLNAKVPQSVSLSPELARIMGYYLSEGNVDGPRQRMTIVQRADDRRGILADVKYIMQQLFNAVPYEQLQENGTVRLVYCSKALAMFFSNLLGHGAANKHIPAIAQEMTWDERTHLLKALWFGDGYMGERGMRYSAVSPHLAHQIPLLAASLGFVVGLQNRRATGPGRPAYQLQVSGWHENVFRKALGVPLRERREGHHKKLFELDNNGFWFKVRSIELLEMKTQVYNLSVVDEVYLAANTAVHNCWRSRKFGWKIVYEPKAVVIHYEHGSGPELLEGHLRKMGILMNRWGNMGSDKHLFGME